MKQNKDDKPNTEIGISVSDGIYVSGYKLSLDCQQNLYMSLFGGRMTVMLPKNASPEGTIVKLFEELMQIDGVLEIFERYGTKVTNKKYLFLK